MSQKNDEYMTAGMDLKQALSDFIKAARAIDKEDAYIASDINDYTLDVSDGMLDLREHL